MQAPVEYIEMACNCENIVNSSDYPFNHFIKMQSPIEQIKEAASGLYFLSESDYPLEPFVWKTSKSELENKILAASEKPAGSLIEKQTLEYFFRNMVKLDDEAIAIKFRKLQQLLNDNLKNIEVYRVGTVQVKVFIVGELPDGSFAGLSTTSIET